MPTASRNMRCRQTCPGAATPLMVDANQAWSVTETLAMLPQLQAFDLQWLEEPLRADRPWSEWLQLRQRNDAEASSSMALMMASTERMVRQANQLLALARSEPGDFERGRLEKLALDKLVAESVQQFVDEAAKKNIDIGFDLPEGEGRKPAALAAAREGKADDLKKIEGIGPALEKLCHELGIFHFDQIAAWGAAEIAWMDGNLKGFKGRVTRDKWVAQAKIIVTEGLAAFLERAKTNDY